MTDPAYEPFESTIIIPDLGKDPEVAGLVVAHVIRNALPLRIKTVEIGRGVLTIAGDAPPTILTAKVHEFGEAAKWMVRQGRTMEKWLAERTLPRTAETP